MKRLLYIIISLLLITCTQLQAQPVHLLHKPHKERQQGIDSMMWSVYQLDSANAIKKINTLTTWAEKEGDEELAYRFSFFTIRLLPSLAEDKEHVATILKTIEKAEKKGYTITATFGYHTLAIALWDRKEYNAGVEYDLKAYNLYKNMTLDEFPDRVDFQHSLVTKYYSFKNYERAKQLLLELKHADKRNLYAILGSGNYNTLALIYTSLKQYDSARLAFQTIFDSCCNKKDFGMAAIAAGNMGQVYYMEKDYDNAIKWLKTEHELSETYSKGHINLNIANSNILLAEVYLLKHMPAEAGISLQNARSYLAIAGDIPYDTWKNYYYWLAKMMSSQGNMAQAYAMLDTAWKYADSAKSVFDKGKLMEAEFKIDKMNHELQVQALEHNRETSVYIRNTAIIVILLLSVIALLVINRSRLRYKQQQVILQQEKEKAEIELDSARKQLDKFTRNIHEKNALIDKFTDELDKLQAKGIADEKNDVLIQLQQSTILTDDEWDEFRTLFEKVHSGFLNRLKEKYTDITPAETRYLALTKLNLSNKEMANMLGTGTTAVRNYKYRLRKKLDLPDDDSFDEMIRNI